jgi:hypothetical protein
MTVLQLFTDFNRSHNSVRKEVLYNILVEFWVGFIKIYLNETFSRVHTGKCLSDNSPTRSGLKREALSLLFPTLL